MPDKSYPPFSILLSFLLFLICLPGISIAATSSASAPTQEQQVEKLQDMYRDLTSISFNFNQITSTGGGRQRQGAGNGIFYRPKDKPGVMRWNYTRPDVQIILNDGSKLSIYTQKDNQMIVTSAKELQSDITYAFFAGTRNLLDDFSVTPADDRFVFSSPDMELQATQLVPRQPHGQIQSMHLWFDQDFLIRKIIMVDHFDSTTELLFTQIRHNNLPVDSPETLADILRLDLPPGTDIISQ